MKKLLSLIALVGIMASCNSKKGEKKEGDGKDTATTTTTTTTTTTDVTTTAADVPKFSDPEVQKYVDDYTAFVVGYVDAYKAKDMTKIQELSTKATEWATKTQTIAMKLSNSPEEATKFSNYMTKLSQDMSAAMMPK